ncbi:MAG: hypothetical protein P8103_01240 [Candidatus Thiodiazotropha sp.]
MENDLSTVIERTALIENILNQVIIKHTAPRDEAYGLFWNVILDSSIMPLGSKVKIAMVIAQKIEIKLDQDSLHKVMSFRNAFAHHDLQSHPALAIGKTPEEDKAYYSLQIINNSGRIIRKSRKAALTEFNDNFNSAKESLIKLLRAIKVNGE